MIGAYYDTVFTAAQAQGLPVDTAGDHAAKACWSLPTDKLLLSRTSPLLGRGRLLHLA